MTAPSPPAERETPVGLEAMREAVAAWLKDEFALTKWKAMRMAITILSSGPIASERARLTAEWDAAREDHVRAEAHICALDLLAYIDPEHTWKDAAIKERVARNTAKADNTRLRADLARKEEEIARLRSALEPFAEAAEGLPDHVVNTNPIAYVSRDAITPGTVFTLVAKHLRAARAALTNPEQTDA